MSDFPEIEYKQEETELELAPDEAAIDFLQKVYRSPRQPLAVRMRAAALAIPFESPKLTAMAVSAMNGDHFATMLEKAIARSQAPLKQIELKPYDGPVLEPRPRGIHGRSGEGQR
jgi:hypothetical protein